MSKYIQQEHHVLDAIQFTNHGHLIVERAEGTIDVILWMFMKECRNIYVFEVIINGPTDGL